MNFPRNIGFRSSSQLTFTHIFQRGGYTTTNQINDGLDHSLTPYTFSTSKGLCPPQRRQPRGLLGGSSHGGRSPSSPGERKSVSCQDWISPTFISVGELTPVTNQLLSGLILSHDGSVCQKNGNIYHQQQPHSCCRINLPYIRILWVSG